MREVCLSSAVLGVKGQGELGDHTASQRGAVTSASFPSLLCPGIDGCTRGMLSDRERELGGSVSGDRLPEDGLAHSGMRPPPSPWLCPPSGRSSDSAFVN